MLVVWDRKMRDHLDWDVPHGEKEALLGRSIHHKVERRKEREDGKSISDPGNREKK